MKRLQHILAFTVITLTLLVSSVKPALALGGWIDHKFELERPDGSRMDLKGAKIHMYLKQEEATSARFNHIANFCAYPDFDSNIGGYVDKDNKPGDITLSGGYHCLTPQSCSRQDYGTPYLPKSFNGNVPYSSWEDTSYSTFHDGKTFTESLTGNVGYLANMYKPNLIRGFEGAKWDMQLDWTNGSGVGRATQAEINDIPNQQGGESWPTVPGFEGNQSWSEGEVYKDPDGGNVLHARITWVLKPPAQPVEKPTATLTGKCANANPGVPSYTFTTSNIDLKGQQFADSHLYLKVPKGAWTDDFKAQFGPPIYENDQTTDYSLIYNTTPPNNNVIVQTVLPTEGVGNKPENKKTVADLVKWVDARKTAKQPLPQFQVATTLMSKNGSNTYLNDFIPAAFKPGFYTNECGTPPPTSPPPSNPPVGACVSIAMLDFGNNLITDYSKLKVGDRIEFQCGAVTGVNQYKFRVLELGANNAVAKTVDLPPYPGRVSTAYTIPSAGKFIAQCAICPNGVCQDFEPANYLPGINTGTGGGTTNPPASSTTNPTRPNPSCIGPNGETSYSCVPEKQCVPTSRKTNPAKVCDNSTYVCCAPASATK